MKLLYSFDELHQIQEKKVYALGTFDGIHKGHQSVIKEAVQEAKASNAVTIIITFERHPLSILNPERLPKTLLAPAMMDEILDEMNVDYILRFPMTQDFLNIEASVFLDNLCKEQDIQAIVVGENFTFGVQGKGTPIFIKESLSNTNIQVIIKPLMTCDGHGKAVSSTMIRQAVKEGRMEDATNMLGRPFQFVGTVIKGDQRGRILGFPTLNFRLPNEMAIPPDGVFVNRVRIDGKWYGGVGNIGDNPTFKNQYHRCEVHVFDFNQDVYGKEVLVQFISYLRGEVKFDNLDALIAQMKLDEAKALSILKTID